MKKEKKKLTYDEIAYLVLDKFDKERAKRRRHNGLCILGCDYEGEEPEATKLAKKLCEENGLPYKPELVDFSCLVEMGF